MDNSILMMHGITKVYQMGEEKQTVLKGIDLEVDQGEFVAVLGPSGSGKSTLMNIIGCLDTPTSGSYILHGRDVGGLDEDTLAGVRSKEIGFIFQSFLQHQVYPPVDPGIQLFSFAVQADTDNTESPVFGGVFP